MPRKGSESSKKLRGSLVGAENLRRTGLPFSYFGKPGRVGEVNFRRTRIVEDEEFKEIDIQSHTIIIFLVIMVKIS